MNTKQNRLAERAGFSAIGGCAFGAEPINPLDTSLHLELIFAERVGFEPTIPLPVYHLSRVANSTALAPLRISSYESKKLVVKPSESCTAL